MAVTVLTDKEAYGFVYTHRITDATDRASLSNNTVFYQEDVDEVFKKDGSGNILEAFSAAGITDNIYTANGTLAGARTVDLATNNLIFDDGQVTINGDSFTSATTALLVQNNSAEMFRVRDDSTIVQTAQTSFYTHKISNANSAGIINLQFDNNLGESLKLRAYGSTYSDPFLANNGFLFTTNKMVHLSISGGHYWTLGSASDATTNMKLVSAGLVVGNGIGTIGALARLHVKGSGSTSATSALFVENSSGSPLFQVKNDGGHNIHGITTIFNQSGNANTLILDGASDSNANFAWYKSGVERWRLQPNFATGQSDQFEWKAGGGATRMTINQTGEFSFGGLAPTTNERMKVTGFSTGFTNKALNVTNSSDTSVFEVRDNGATGIGRAAVSGKQLEVNGITTIHTTSNANLLVMNGATDANPNFSFQKSATEQWGFRPNFATAGSDEMKILSAGNGNVMTWLQNGDIGISTVPSARLHLNGTFRVDGQTATGATAGADTLPSNPVGFININLDGTAYKVPYYAV